MGRWSLLAVVAAFAFSAWLSGLGLTPAANPSRVTGLARPRVGFRLSVFRFVDRRRVADFRNGTSGPRTLVTYVRYPTGGVGRSPLIVFCHGFALLPGTYRRLLDAWARAGYVVAAPLFPVENADAPGGPDEADLVNQPGDVSFLISQLVRASERQTSRLYGRIDPTRIAVAGHSDGGDTAFAVAYERRYLDWRVRAAVVLSGAALPPDEIMSRRHSPPLLAVQGSADRINPPAATQDIFQEVPKPKYLLTLPGEGHLGPYTDDAGHLAVVERVTIAFLNHYLDNAPLRLLLDAGNASKLAHLTSRP